MSPRDGRCPRRARGNNKLDDSDSGNEDCCCTQANQEDSKSSANQSQAKTSTSAAAAAASRESNPIVASAVQKVIFLRKENMAQLDKSAMNALMAKSVDGGNKARRAGEEEELSAVQALVKAFTKSFRLSLLDILTYMMFLAPSFGVIACSFSGAAVDAGFEELTEELDLTQEKLCSDTIHMNINVRRLFVMVFVLARTFQPALLMIHDKTLKKRIRDIVRDGYSNREFDDGGIFVGGAYCMLKLYRFRTD